MIDAILKTLKTEVGGQIIEKANIPSGQLDDVFKVIGESAQKEVGSQMASGGISTLMNLFSKNSNSSGANQLQSSIQSSIISGLIKKLGLSDSIAQTISQIAVPALINLISNKNSQTPDDDPSPLNDIFSQVTKGKGGIGGVLGKLFK